MPSSILNRSISVSFRIDDFENDTLVSAESIDVAVNVMSLFSDKGFDVNYVVLDKPSIKAVKLADGRVNWDIMKPDTVDVEEEKTDRLCGRFHAYAILYR